MRTLCRTVALLVLMLVCACGTVAASQAPASGGLRVIVIDGDEAASIVADKLAAEPVIEVRDSQNRRVTGAVVRFVIKKTVRDRLPSLFRNGQSEVRTLTDAAGRARAGVITPVESGSVEIEVEVSHQGQTATATVRHTNYATSAEAQAAGRKPPSQSSGSNAASQAAVSAGGTGGGLSTLAIIGLAAGGAAGVGAAVALSQQPDSAPPAGRVTAVTASGTGGVQAATPFTFSVQVSDFEAGSLAYRWEFGDGASSTEAAPTHVYNSAGTFTVVATVSDARQSARSEIAVTVYTLTGIWTGTLTGLGYGGPAMMQLTQSGTTINGLTTGPGAGGFASVIFIDCMVSGSVQPGTPAVVTLDSLPCPHPTIPGVGIGPAAYDLRMGIDGRTLFGNRVGPVSNRDSLTLQRQP